MTLYEQWEDLFQNQTKASFQDFWKEYSDAEIKIYSNLLEHPDMKVSGTLQEFVDKYQVRPAIFMGFLSGVDDSLKAKNDFEHFDEGSQVELDIDPEKLYYNMQAAQADHLYTLPQWDTILTEEKREEIAKAYKRSKTVVKGKKIGRNDPCPCGSGKKYKYCCGR